MYSSPWRWSTFWRKWRRAVMGETLRGRIGRLIVLGFAVGVLAATLAACAACVGYSCRY